MDRNVTFGHSVTYYVLDSREHVESRRPNLDGMRF